jgi:hypothetical protein
MTETYFIEISQEQKQTLMQIFEAFNVPISPVISKKTKEKVLADINSNTSDKVFYSNFIESIEWSNAKAKGTIEKGQSLSDFLDEVEIELSSSKNIAHAH